MRVDQFDFNLPEDRIALRPLEDRMAARLLCVGEQGVLTDHIVADLADFVRSGDAVVFNDTKVIPAQLNGKRIRLDALTGEHVEAQIAVTLHMRTSANSWNAFIKPSKKVREGEIIEFEDGLTARLESKNETGDVSLLFNKSNAELDAAIAQIGSMPLPPYIASKRGEDAQDKHDYQTSYAEHEGAVAAPTAGLHFTNALMEKLKEAGASMHFLTLHVGAGTFLPVKADDTADHKMHSEIGILTDDTAQALNQVRANGGRIIAIGTTSMRLLESATDEQGVLHEFADATDIFITPGYQFKCVDMLMTNFHLPKSTLFMLVSAFSGLEAMKNAYQHAIDKKYRFYSYGDACLLMPKNPKN